MLRRAVPGIEVNYPETKLSHILSKPANKRNSVFKQTQHDIFPPLVTQLNHHSISITSRIMSTRKLTANYTRRDELVASRGLDSQLPIKCLSTPYQCGKWRNSLPSLAGGACTAGSQSASRAAVSTGGWSVHATRREAKYCPPHGPHRPPGAAGPVRDRAPVVSPSQRHTRPGSARLWRSPGQVHTQT